MKILSPVRSPKICILQNQQEGGGASEGGLLKFQASNFNIFNLPSPVILFKIEYFHSHDWQLCKIIGTKESSHLYGYQATIQQS